MSEFVKKPLQQKLNRRNFISRIEQLERLNTPIPSATVNGLTEVGDIGSGAALDENGIIFDSQPFPEQDSIQWRADNDIVSRILGFFVPNVASGIYYIGQEKDANHYGVAGFAVQGDTQTLGQYLMLLQLDSQGISGRAFLEHNIGGTDLRRSYLPAAGWLPYAYQYGCDAIQDVTTASLSLTANGGCVAIPVFVPAPMMLRSVTVWNGNTATQRAWNWGLYEQYTQTESASENSLTQKAAGAAAETFTPSAQSARTITAASAPIYLGPGLYWLVVQNTHASNIFDVGRINPAAIATMGTMTRSKVITNPMGATLDFVAPTWVARTGEYGVRLNGEVFGESTIY